MEKKLSEFLFFLILLCFVTSPLVAAESNAVTEKKSLSNQPIIIETQVPQYEEPSLTDYQQCYESRERCLSVCKTHTNVTACEAECLVCPMLISHDLFVQGVNDTDYRAPSDTSVNATNIIKITNEIRNIVDNTKNITARNENNIHIYQTNTTVGGKYGLGYNQNGPCCQVVREKGNCNSRAGAQQSTCRQKRQRVCGARCKARVMYAKPVTSCNGDPTDGTENCHQSFIYTPYRRQQQHHYRVPQTKCHYMPNWPFVACGNPHRRAPNASICQSCLKLPYGYILNKGVPPRCGGCFRRSPGSYYSAPVWYAAPPQYMGGAYGPYSPPAFDNGFMDWDDNFPSNGWKVEKVKCRLPDGTISENCDIPTDDEDIIVEQPELPHVTEDPLEHLPEAQDELAYEDDYADYAGEDEQGDDYLGEVEAMRRRRHVFHRSAYSHRND